MQPLLANLSDLEGIEVKYITLPGWKTSLASIRKYDDLPENAKKYVKHIEDYVKVPGICRHFFFFIVVYSCSYWRVQFANQRKKLRADSWLVSQAAKMGCILSIFS